MSNSSGSANFQCPKCLSNFSVRPEQAGTNVTCPACGAVLSVPENLFDGALFDDLFDDDPDEEFEENPNTMSDESELDTGFLEEINFSSMQQADDSQTSTAEAVPEPELTSPSFKDESPESGRDPFEYDENRPIKIEGITRNVDSPDSFYAKCPICDSELQVEHNQIGKMVNCSDCQSDFRVARPKRKRKKDVWRQPAKTKQESDDDFSLEPPVDLPQIEPGYGLENVNDDLLAPVETNEPDPETQSPGPRTKPTRRNTPKKTATPTNVGNRNSGASDPDSTATKPVHWKQIFELELFQDFDLIMRSVVVTVFLALGYAMMESVGNTLEREDINGGEKFVSYFPALLGSLVCLAVSYWFLSITFSVVMSSIANGLKKVEEWIGFSPSEWLGSFVVIVVSCWASLLPGVLFGYFVFKLLGAFFFLPLFAATSAFTLMPVFLISSYYNQSPFNIFAPDVVKTISTSTNNWIEAYKLFGVALGVFVLGLLLLLIPGILFSFLGAAVQVAAITALSVFVGLHAKSIFALLTHDINNA